MSLSEIKNKVHQAEEEFSKTIGSTKIIAVSKVQPIAKVRAVLEMVIVSLEKTGFKKSNRNGQILRKNTIM